MCCHLGVRNCRVPVSGNDFSFDKDGTRLRCTAVVLLWKSGNPLSCPLSFQHVYSEYSLIVGSSSQQHHGNALCRLLSHARQLHYSAVDLMPVTEAGGSLKDTNL